MCRCVHPASSLSQCSSLYLFHSLSSVCYHLISSLSFLSFFSPSLSLSTLSSTLSFTLSLPPQPSMESYQQTIPLSLSFEVQRERETKREWDRERERKRERERECIEVLRSIIIFPPIWNVDSPMIHSFFGRNTLNKHVMLQSHQNSVIRGDCLDSVLWWCIFGISQSSNQTRFIITNSHI